MGEVKVSSLIGKRKKSSAVARRDDSQDVVGKSQRRFAVAKIFLAWKVRRLKRSRSWSNITQRKHLHAKIDANSTGLHNFLPGKDVKLWLLSVVRWRRGPHTRTPKSIALRLHHVRTFQRDCATSTDRLLWRWTIRPSRDRGSIRLKLRWKWMEQ